jgi:hypothetical protein
MKANPTRNVSVVCSLITVLLLVFVWACNKGREKLPIKEVTGYAWKVGILKDGADPYISPLPAGWQMKLADDRKVSVYLNGTTCTGTYTWTEIDSVSAYVNFSFSKWNDPAEFPGSAQKLKNVLVGINKCYILKGVDVPPTMSGFTNPTIVIDFEGRNGFVYVYR